jgi:hypothetical protein
MKRKTLKFGKGFRSVAGNERTQAAEVTLAPGETEGRPATDAVLGECRGSGQCAMP